MRLIKIGVFIFFLMSCNQANNEEFITTDNKHFVKIIYDENNKIVSKESMIKNYQGNFIKEGVFKRYYSNNNLAETLNYKNGIRQGIASEFYKSGRLKSNFFYINDKEDSIRVNYHENGEMAGWYFRHEGILYGIQTEFYPNKKIRRMFFSTPQSPLLFNVVFDEIGQIITMEGIPLAIHENNNPVKKGQMFGIINDVFKTPFWTSELKITLKDEKGRIIRDTAVKKLQFLRNNYVCKFKHFFEKTGHYEYSVVLILKDSLDKLLRKDSLKDIITVIE